MWFIASTFSKLALVQLDRLPDQLLSFAGGNTSSPWPCGRRASTRSRCSFHRRTQPGCLFDRRSAAVLPDTRHLSAPGCHCSCAEALAPDDRDVSLTVERRRGQGPDTVWRGASVDAGRRSSLLPTPMNPLIPNCSEVSLGWVD